jgi:hypothetical protein
VDSPRGCARLLAGLGLAIVAVTFNAGVAWATPTANFGYTPEAPLTHQPVTFKSSSSTVPPNTIVSQTWDLDNDDVYDDASGPVASWTFTRPGPHIVGIEVTDTSAVPVDHKRIRIVIANRTPVPSMMTLPAAPAPGQQVTFLSNSYDPDGFIAGYAWDIDNDGAFDDGSGPSIATTFPAGRHSVGLRVTDDSGDSASSSVLVEVGGVTASATPILSPFPIVRISGLVRKQGIKVRLLSITGPVGATVHVRCSGRGCPFRRTSALVRNTEASATLPAGTGVVRVNRFRNRLLRRNARVTIFVVKQGFVGKYTRLRIRKGKPPARVDRCVTSVNARPFACP